MSPKYGNKRATASDGTIMASKRERKRYEELILLQRLGKISGLETQVRYVLIPAQKMDGFTERSVTYTADFRYLDKEKGEWIVEDAKGAKTQQYIIRRKLMLYMHRIRVVEV